MEKRLLVEDKGASPFIIVGDKLWAAVTPNFMKTFVALGRNIGGIKGRRLPFEFYYGTHVLSLLGSK